MLIQDLNLKPFGSQKAQVPPFPLGGTLRLLIFIKCELGQSEESVHFKQMFKTSVIVRFCFNILNFKFYMQLLSSIPFHRRTKGASAAGNCTNATAAGSRPAHLCCRFLCHLTHADGTEVTAGEQFFKTWRVRNDGAYARRLSRPRVFRPAVGAGQWQAGTHVI